MAIFITAQREEVYRSRALAAYYRGAHTLDPSHSTIRTFRDRYYLYLGRRKEVLAAYRIDNSGRLKRLKRWPTESDIDKWNLEYIKNFMALKPETGYRN